MSDVVEARQLALDQFDARYCGLRLQATAAAQQAMVQSLRRYGQLSPLVVWPTDGAWVWKKPGSSALWCAKKG